VNFPDTRFSDSHRSVSSNRGLVGYDAVWAVGW